MNTYTNSTDTYGYWIADNNTNVVDATPSVPPIATNRKELDEVKNKFEVLS